MSCGSRPFLACPRHLLVCEKSSFLQEKSRHSTHVETHYYNYCVSILLPECALLPEKLKHIIEGMGTYYLVKNLPLHEFLTEEFNDRFLKKGLFYALSYNTRIDQDNVAAVLPTVVTIDLTDSAMSPDGKKFQRVRWALTEKKPLNFDFLFTWDNTEEPSILSYFSKYVVKECQFKINSGVSRELNCPVLKSDELHGKEEESCSATEFFEWLGAISNNIDWENESSSFISSFCCPEPNILIEQAHLCTITGFITPAKIQKLVKQLREYFNEPKLSQWVSLMVHGFADSPVSWRESEHGFFKGGENLYCFVIFNNEDYWLQMAVGTNDGCPP
ncbi:ribonuclease P protein subunit p40 isoform X2 [Rhinoderma darwinii]|uniref:ribonuclease P protein subunit p40 isoform X2 n=1 Tax=Rhinoderma darwinii TaxID=43563 RepID=UPI003F67E3B6